MFEQDNIRPNPFYCRRCHRWYRQFRSSLWACGVAHAPGSCCHFNDREITVAEVRAIYGENAILEPVTT